VKYQHPFLVPNATDRTLLEKIRDAIRIIISKLTSAERRQAQAAEGKLSAALEAANRQSIDCKGISTVIRLVHQRIP